MNKEIIYMGHPAHFVCADRCQFFLSTYVNGFIVSTVGEYLPDETIREIFARSRGVELIGEGDNRKKDYMKKIGYEQIGFNRIYETMVFKAKKSNLICCPYVIESGLEIETKGYNDADTATVGHMELINKYKEKQK